MFSQVIGLRQWLALGAGFVLIAALVWQAFYFMGKGKAEAEAKLRPQLVKLERELSVCQLARDGALSAIASQNEAVRQLARERDEAEKNALAARKLAEDRARRELSAIEALRQMSPSGDRCEAARKLLVEELGG